MGEFSPKTVKLFDDNAAEASVHLDADTPSEVPVADRKTHAVAEAAFSTRNEEQPAKPQNLPRQKHKRGKRKGKRVPNDQSATAENVGSGVESINEHVGNGEVMNSNEEDAQTEHMVEGVEAEKPIKMEERKCIRETRSGGKAKSLCHSRREEGCNGLFKRYRKSVCTAQRQVSVASF